MSEYRDQREGQADDDTKNHALEKIDHLLVRVGKLRFQHSPSQYMVIQAQHRQDERIQHQRISKILTVTSIRKIYR